MLQPLSTAIETVAGVSVSTIGQPPQQALKALLAVIRTLAAADFAAVLLRTGSVTAEAIACDPPDFLPAGSTHSELIDAALADGRPWFGRTASTPILAGLCGSHAVLPLGKDVAAVIGRRSEVDFDADERTLLSIGRGQLAPVVQSVCVDITERKQAREQLGLNEARLRAVIENIGDRVWSVDRQYRLLVANSPYSRGVEELLGRYPALGDGSWMGFRRQPRHSGSPCTIGRSPARHLPSRRQPSGAAAARSNSISTQFVMPKAR